MKLRQLDGKNRITLPYEIRRDMKVDGDTVFKIEVKDGAVLLIPVSVVTKEKE